MALPALKEVAPPKLEPLQRQIPHDQPPKPRPDFWTVEQYFELLEASDFKVEYIDGIIYDMPACTDNHDVITVNVIFCFASLRRGSDCALRTGNMKVGIAGSKYVFPDLTVVCGKPELDNNTTTLLNPSVLVEITSPSSIKHDRETKRAVYQAIPSVQAYIIIHQDRVYVELHTRLEDGWALQEFSDLDDKLVIDAINCELALAEIYAGIALPER